MDAPMFIDMNAVLTGLGSVAVSLGGVAGVKRFAAWIVKSVAEQRQAEIKAYTKRIDTLETTVSTITAKLEECQKQHTDTSIMLARVDTALKILAPGLSLPSMIMEEPFNGISSNKEGHVNIPTVP